MGVEMKIKKALLLNLSVSLMVLASGCLTFRSQRVDINFSDDFLSGSIQVTYTGLGSTESDLEKQREDFEQLRKAVEENDFLLDAMEDGIYVQSIELNKEGDGLTGSYSGIFRALKMDGQQLLVQGAERMLVVGKEKGCTIRSNGKITEDEENFTLIWPKIEHNIWYELSCDRHEPVHSLVAYFDAWKQTDN